MAFEMTGKIIAVLDKKSGVSVRTGTPWSMQQYVLETHDQYPKKRCFDVFGEDKISQFSISIGEELKVYFDIDSREYQGKWYNSFRAWKVERTTPPNKVNVGNDTPNDVIFDMPWDNTTDLPPF